MKEKSQVRTGIILSYVSLALSTIIPFIYTPIMLRMLGEQEYGLYSLARSVIGYLGLLSFGLGSTILRYIATYRAKGEKKQLENAFGFFLVLYGGIAILTVLIGLVLTANAEAIFHRGLTGEEISRIRTLLLIMTANTALSFPVSVFTSVTIAFERYYFRKFVEILYTVAVPLLSLAALYMGFASVGMAMTSLLMQILMVPLNAGYCMRVLQVRPAFERLPVSLIKEMMGFSVYVFLAMIVEILFWSTDKVILGMLINSTAVAVYSVGGTFNEMVGSMSTSISNVLAPRVTTMVARESTSEELSQLFIKVGRIQFLIVALVTSGFVTFGYRFVSMWAGPNYQPAYWIALLTMLPRVVPLIQNTGVNIVVAQNKHKFRSIVYLIIAVINAVSTYLLVPYMGAVGAALCSCIAYILGHGIIMNLYYLKVTRLDIAAFWRNILGMSVIPVLMTGAGLILEAAVHTDGWLLFFVKVAAYTALYCAAMYKFIMNDYEKSIITGYLARIPLFRKNSHE